MRRLMMDNKTISSCWRDSIVYFKKENLKLYILGSLGTWKRALEILIHRFWWLFLAWLFWLGYLVWGLGIDALATSWVTSLSGFFLKITMAVFVTWFFQAMIYYVIIMALRPSIEAKDYAYFMKYSHSFWLFFIVGIFTSNLIFFSLITLPLLFFLDSDQSLKSLYLSLIRGFKAMVYFLPFFLAIVIALILMIGIIAVAALLPLLIISKFIYPEWALFTLKLSEPLLPRWFATVATVQTAIFVELGVVLGLAALCVFYIKVKHEHADLFLAEK